MRAKRMLPLLAVMAVTATTAGALDRKGSGKMTTESATGNFDVVLAPVGAVGIPVGAMSITKTFRGDLDATSTGQMLASRTPVDGSAGYVAMEHVTGTLGGRRGAFVLQHSGTMNRGVQSLSVSVVPDSATGELTGLTGTMDIDISGGGHRYTFRYSLPR